MQLQGHNALVTGASGGLGAAVACYLAKEGARLGLVGRREEGLDETLKQLPHPDDVWAVSQDLTELGAASRVIEECAQSIGPLTVVVHCAANFVYKPFLELEPADWEHVMHVNLDAGFLLTQAAARHMMGHKKGGSIVHIASVHAAIPDANLVPHCTSKAGLVAMTRAAAEALRPHNIRVNAVSPGEIAESSATQAGPDDVWRVTQLDVARTVGFLVSEASSSVTGSNIELYGRSRPVVGTS